MIDIIWIKKAVHLVANGEAEKMTKDNITVYAVKNIVRVDIKKSEV